MSRHAQVAEELIKLRLDRLRLTREMRGISQQELARACGIGINQINRYENGVTEPSAAILALIAQKLDVSTDYLFGLTDTPSSASIESLRQDERKLLEAYTLGDSLTLMALMVERMQNLAAQHGTKAEE